MLTQKPEANLPVREPRLEGCMRSNPMGLTPWAWCVGQARCGVGRPAAAKQGPGGGCCPRPASPVLVAPGPAARALRQRGSPLRPQLTRPGLWCQGSAGVSPDPSPGTLELPRSLFQACLLLSFQTLGPSCQPCLGLSGPPPSPAPYPHQHLHSGQCGSGLRSNRGFPESDSPPSLLPPCSGLCPLHRLPWPPASALHPCSVCTEQPQTRPCGASASSLSSPLTLTVVAGWLVRWPSPLRERALPGWEAHHLSSVALSPAAGLRSASSVAAC